VPAVVYGRGAGRIGLDRLEPRYHCRVGALPDRNLPTAELIAALSKPVGQANPEAVTVALGLLHDSMQRAIEAKAQLDAKAALVLPAVATVAALLADHAAVSASPCLNAPTGDLVARVGLCAPVLTLGALVVAAAGSVIFALVCLLPSAWKYGPDPVFVVSIDDADATTYRHAMAATLAASVVDIERLVTRKGRWWNRSILWGGAAVVLLIALAAVGGLR